MPKITPNVLGSEYFDGDLHTEYSDLHAGEYTIYTSGDEVVLTGMDLDVDADMECDALIYVTAIVWSNYTSFEPHRLGGYLDLAVDDDVKKTVWVEPVADSDENEYNYINATIHYAIKDFSSGEHSIQVRAGKTEESDDSYIIVHNRAIQVILFYK